MDENEEFLAMCREVKKIAESPVEPSPSPPYVPPPKMELTLKQKVVVLKYVLAGPGKGMFEDCEDFWDGVEDIEEVYPSLRDATEDYLAEVKQRLLAEMGIEDDDF